MRKPVPDDGRFMKDEGTEPFPYLRCFPEGSLFLDCLLLFSVAGVGNPIGSDLGKRLGGGSVLAGFGFSGFVKTDCGLGAESNSFGPCRAEAWRVLRIENPKQALWVLSRFVFFARRSERRGSGFSDRAFFWKITLILRRSCFLEKTGGIGAGHVRDPCRSLCG